MALMFYLIYRITNKINNKIYVGTHKTKNKNDNYMGSGKYLNHAIRKYGLENFTKEILFEFDNAKEMFDKESEIVNDEFLAEENTYNLKRGGFGGFDYINLQKLNNSANQCSKAGQAAKARGGGFKDKKHTDKTKKLISELATGRPPTFLGKHHSDETKNLMSVAHIGLCTGSKNSQYDTCWIWHETIGNKKCKIDDLPLYIDQGWLKGRICQPRLTQRAS